MIYPTIHLNGTSKESLIEQWSVAYIALHDACRTLQDAGPHGRDYYPQGPEAIFIAVKEHRENLAKIEAVMEYLDALALRATFPV
jgi:hypothetical protein